MGDNAEKRSKWRNRISEQERSGESMTAWCRRNDVSYSTFQYWRTKFSNETDPHGFVELIEEEPAATGIDLSIGHVRVHLRQNFDLSTLKRLVSVLGSSVC